MLTNFNRLLNEVRIVRQILPKHLFIRWLKGIFKCFEDLVEYKSLGALDKNFGDSFEIVWNDQKLHFEHLDFGVVREIYGHLCYAQKGELKEAHHILDLGANAGAFTIFALVEAPHAQVHAVEAQLELAEIAKHNIQVNRYEERAVVECALVGDFDDEWTNSLLENNPTLTKFDIWSYISSVGTCDFLKCDVEGAEFQLFQGDLSWTQAVKNMALEFHPTKGDVDELEKRLKAHNFQVQRVEHSCLGYFYCTRE